MQIRTINAPAHHLLQMLHHHVSPEARTWMSENPVSSLALFQTSIADLYFFADVAMKAADVFTTEVLGTCPTHISTLALMGDTSAVRAAVKAIEDIAGAP